MTILYRAVDGWAQFMCDTCFTKTRFYATIAELLAATHYNRPLTDDDAGWCDGVGKKITGPAFQPTYQINPQKTLCPSCRGFFEEAAYKSDWVPHKYDGKIGKVGQPERTSADEDSQLGKTDLFKGTTPLTPRIFPKSEPDESNDNIIYPLESGNDES